jgi:hypothetical protein
MSTSKVNVDDDVIPEFDFSRSIPSPFRHLARKGMRFHIVTDGADLPTYHVTSSRLARRFAMNSGPRPDCALVLVQ